MRNGRLELDIEVSRIDPSAGGGSAVDLLARASGLPKGRIKDAMLKGAVRLRRHGHTRLLRRAQTVLKPGDRLALHYDPDILAKVPEPATLLADEGGYSVWDKPAGMLAQGTLWGDHLSLLRAAEQALRPRPVLLVHRLDREARGLMLLAHGQRAAAQLSRLFQTGAVHKTYRVVVRGLPAPPGSGGGIERPLDGRPAVSRYTVLRHDPARDRAELEVVIETGRRHQIRRHLEALGHPVIGDPAYGRGNKDPGGLRLAAVRLAFTCPITGAQRDYRLADAAGGADPWM